MFKEQKDRWPGKDKHIESLSERASQIQVRPFRKPRSSVVPATLLCSFPLSSPFLRSPRWCAHRTREEETEKEEKNPGDRPTQGVKGREQMKPGEPESRHLIGEQQFHCFSKCPHLSSWGGLARYWDHYIINGETENREMTVLAQVCSSKEQYGDLTNVGPSALLTPVPSPGCALTTLFPHQHPFTVALKPEQKLFTGHYHVQG